MQSSIPMYLIVFLLHLVSSSANTDFSQLEQALQYAIDVEDTIQICITYTKSFQVFIHWQGLTEKTLISGRE